VASLGGLNKGKRTLIAIDFHLNLWYEVSFHGSSVDGALSCIVFGKIGRI